MARLPEPEQYMTGQTRNLRYLRAANRGEVLRLLASLGPMTRNELAGRLGLTKMAISTITNDLISEGILASSDDACDLPGRLATGSRAGRRPERLVLVPASILVPGIYLSRDRMEGVLADGAGHAVKLWCRDVATEIDRAGYISQLRSLLSDMTSQMPSCGVPGFGVSCIGPLDLKQGRLLAPPNFHRIADLPLRDLVAEQTHVPVWIDNDMNAAALAESLFGGWQARQMVYIGLTNGVGSGLIVDGQVYRGGSGNAGEIGHMSLDMNGDACPCGHRGCLEQLVSVPVLLSRTGTGHVAELAARSVTDTRLREAWQPGFIQAMGTALVNLANLFDPELIVIGHEGSALAGLVLPELQELIRQKAFQRVTQEIRLAPAALGEQSPLIGAAALVFQAVFRGEASLPVSGLACSGRTGE